jgi:hypothetical protein
VQVAVPMRPCRLPSLAGHRRDRGAQAEQQQALRTTASTITMRLR